MAMDYTTEEGGAHSEDWKQAVKNNLIWIIIIAYWGIWTYMGWGALVEDIKEQDRNAVFLALVYAMGNYAYFEMYKRTPHVVWNGGHSTWTGRRICVDNYVILPLGGVKALGVDFRAGSEGHLIYPATAENLIGESMAVTVAGDPDELNALPPNVRKKVMKWGMNPPFVVGYADADQYSDTVTINVEKNPEMREMFKETMPGELKKVEVGYLVSEIVEKNKHNAMLSNILAGKTDELENVAGSFGRIHNKVTQKKSPLAEQWESMKDQPKG